MINGKMAEVHVDIETNFGYFLLVCGKESMELVAGFLYDYRVKYQICPAEDKNDEDDNFDLFKVDHVKLAIPKNDQIPEVKERLYYILDVLTHVE